MLPDLVRVLLKNDPSTKKSALYLQIWSETEQRDIQDWWSVIEDWQGMYKSQQGISLSGKTSEEIIKEVENSPNPIPFIKKQKSKKDKTFTMLKKYKQAYDLRTKEKKSYKEIGRIVGCDESHVSVFIKRFKDAVSQNRLD